MFVSESESADVMSLWPNVMLTNLRLPWQQALTFDQVALCMRHRA